MTGGGEPRPDHDRLAGRQAAVARAVASSSEKAAGDALGEVPGPALDAGQVAWSRRQLRIKRAGAIAHRAPLLADAVAASGSTLTAEYLAWIDGVGGGDGAETLGEAAALSAHLCSRMAMPLAVVDELLVLRDRAAGPSRARVLRQGGRWMIRIGERRRFGGR
ncbi:hypothetical protein ACFWGD_06465 [Corynebacterium sp. NPDC060344]|uniref:hypothetical protein n=1 Tax=Corynebacterium sp. NPDC060344 TaxID=3347101 RepID=UPI003649710D